MIIPIDGYRRSLRYQHVTYYLHREKFIYEILEMADTKPKVSKIKKPVEWYFFGLCISWRKTTLKKNTNHEECWQKVPGDSFYCKNLAYVRV